MYQIVFDPFYKEESEDLTSLFAIYVLKCYNKHNPVNEGLPVAWFWDVLQISIQHTRTSRSWIHGTTVQYKVR